MRYASITCFIAMLAFTIHAQTAGAINVRGKVTSGGAPVVGATVTLLGKAKSTTTDAQGAYLITETTALSSSDRSMTGNFQFRNGVLELGFPQSSVVKVEVFDVMGNLIKKVAPKSIDAGVYRMNVADLSQAPQILFVKASIGEESRTWRFDSFQNGINLVNSRAGNAETASGAGLAKVSAVVDSIKVVKQGFADKVVTIESFDATVDIAITASTGGGKPVEDDGLDCKVTASSGSNGGSATVLPDPFTKWDGTQVKTMADWRCRRRELVLEVEKTMLGAKAPPPHTIGGTVTGSITDTKYTVTVTNPGGSPVTFSGDVVLPKSGTKPYPVFVVLNIAGFGTHNFVAADMESEGIAYMMMNPYTIAAEAANGYTTGLYYTANPDFKKKTGALVAWGWGVSRIIDMLEKNPGTLDPARVGVTGCSRFGKGTFVSGAFDQRIKLTVPVEPGTGGPAPLRALPTMGGQTLASCNSEASWFGPMSPQYSATMAADMSDVAAMYAPRGLLLMDNPTIQHLSYQANYLGMAAAREFYTAMGKENAIWYMGNSSNGGHCSVRQEYSPAFKAMVQRFWKGNDAAVTGGLAKSSAHGTINVENWTKGWKKGTIAP